MDETQKQIPFQTQQDVIQWIQSFQRFGIKPGLERVEWMLERCGNPQNDLKMIHVAGTNGKGSTCKLIASALKANGYQVGLFTSPYLEAFNNRIAINDQDINQQELCQVANEMYRVLETMPITDCGQITEFEIITVLALLYYSLQKTDYVVMETGLGGRLDATNIIRPIISVITNIGYDHIHILGSSLAEIAYEKAGIIKEGVPVVTGVRQSEAINVIRRVCNEKKSQLYELGIDFHNKIEHIDLQKLQIQFVFADQLFLEVPSWETGLVAMYQADNLSLALATVHILQKRGLVDLKANETKQGIINAVWDGRFEVMQQSPITIVDGAHNPEGMRALIQSLETHFEEQQRYIWCVGFLQDKEIDSMLGEILIRADKVIVTRPNSERSADPDWVKTRIEQFYADHPSIGQSRSEIFIEEDILSAVSKAVELAVNEEVICIAGSLYMISEARKWWTKKE